MGACCSKEAELDFNQEVCLAHFDLLRSIGKGAFGKVKIVQHKQLREKFALKYINKEQCVKMKAVDNIIQERKLLEVVHCPFVCNLQFAFQDDEHMFMVMDLKLGGDMRFLLTNNGGKLPEKWVQFYVAEIALALMYLHSKNVVHRDLKPDNILLDEKGHACLTDFNISTYWKEGKSLHAVAGSLVYMAPEILEQKAGYTYTIDWWSLGVIHYEMICGKRPFRAKKNDELKKLIISGPLEWPSDGEIMISDDCKDMIRGFLTRPACDRLGAKESGGDTRINTHPWLIEIDWEGMEQQTLTPPHVPDPSKFNFDDKHEMNEMFYEDAPLKAKQRKKDKDGKPALASKMAKMSGDLCKEYQKIEEKYAVFDFRTLPPQTERKRSKVWTQKIDEIQRQVSMSRSSLASNRSSAVDLWENRSEHVVFDADTFTIRSKMTSVASRASGNNASAHSLEHAVPEVPGGVGTQSKAPSMDVISVHSLQRTGLPPAPPSNPSLKTSESQVLLGAAEEGTQTKGAGPSPLGTAAPVLEGTDASDEMEPLSTNDVALPNQDAENANLNEQGEMNARDKTLEKSGSDVMDAEEPIAQEKEDPVGGDCASAD